MSNCQDFFTWRRSDIWLFMYFRSFFLSLFWSLFTVCVNSIARLLSFLERPSSRCRTLASQTTQLKPRYNGKNRALKKSERQHVCQHDKELIAIKEINAAKNFNANCAISAKFHYNPFTRLSAMQHLRQVVTSCSSLLTYWPLTLTLAHA